MTGPANGFVCLLPLQYPRLVKVSVGHAVSLRVTRQSAALIGPSQVPLARMVAAAQAQPETEAVQHASRDRGDRQSAAHRWLNSLGMFQPPEESQSLNTNASRSGCGGFLFTRGAAKWY